MTRDVAEHILKVMLSLCYILKPFIAKDMQNDWGTIIMGIESITFIPLEGDEKYG